MIFNFLSSFTDMVMSMWLFAHHRSQSKTQNETWNQINLNIVSALLYHQPWLLIELGNVIFFHTSCNGYTTMILICKKWLSAKW